MDRPGQLETGHAVALEELGGLMDPADPRVARATQLLGPPDQRLEGVLAIVVELHPPLVEDLQAVVVGRVVGGRDHDPGTEVAAAGEEGEGRRRQGAGKVDVGAHAGRPGRDRRHEHAARAAGVLADDERLAARQELMGRRPAEGIGQGRLEVDVGDPADPVGSEEPGHQGPADGRAVGGGVAGAMETVTETVWGDSPIRVRLAGRLTVGVRTWTPGRQAVDIDGDRERLARRCPARAAGEPPRVTRIWSTDRL